MTIKEALNRAVYKIKDAKIETPFLKARILLQFTLQKPREYIIIYDKKELTPKEEKKYMANVDKLISGIPLQHITHSQEFMKMSFYVDENVLIPRQDTEVLVEEVITIIKRLTRPLVLDLCTGSGAIAVSLAKYCDNAIIHASDISKKAITVAKKNAVKNEVSNRIKFIESDLFEKIPKTKYDIIVSNPPYIRRDELEKLADEVRKEPKIALDGGYDGLKFYRRILNSAYDYLKYNGYLCLEIGYDQKEDVTELIRASDRYNHTYTKKDYYDNDRVVVTRIGD